MSWEASDWEYQSGSEDSISLTLVTGAGGRLIFHNTVTEEFLEFRFDVLSVGYAKGFPFNVAKSLLSTPCGGFANVRVRRGYPFNVTRFPCRGFVIAGGLTAGVFSPSFIDDSGIGVSLLALGIKPFVFAWVPIWGAFSSALPGGGVSGGIIQFTDATSYVKPQAATSADWSIG